jgi:hypothetical protein
MFATRGSHYFWPGALKRGDWAVPQKAATALDRYGLVEEVAVLVAFAGPFGT